MAIILGLFFYLRLININRPFWADEAVSLRTLGVSLTSNPLFYGVSTNLPLFYYALQIFQIFPAISPQIYRLLPLLFNFLTLAFVYQYLKSKHSNRLALCFAFLFSLAPIQVYYATELRAYSLAQFLIAIQVISLFEVLRGSKKYLSLFLVSSLLSFLTHYCGYIIFGVGFLLTILIFIRQRRISKSLLAIFSCLLLFGMLIFSLMLKGPTFSSSMSTVGHDKINLSNLGSMFTGPSIERVKEVVTFYYWYGLYYYEAEPWTQFFMKKISLVLILLGALFMWTNRRNINDRLVYFVMLLLLPSLVLALAGEKLGLYPFGGRHIMPYSFILYIFFSYVISKIYLKTRTILIILLLIGICLGTFSYCGSKNISQTDQGSIYSQCVLKLF